MRSREGVRKRVRGGGGEEEDEGRRGRVGLPPHVDMTRSARNSFPWWREAAIPGLIMVTITASFTFHVSTLSC